MIPEGLQMSSMGNQVLQTDLSRMIHFELVFDSDSFKQSWALNHVQVAEVCLLFQWVTLRRKVT